MELILLVFFLVPLLLVLLHILSKPKYIDIIPEICPPHKWITNQEDGNLVCLKCKKKPGEIKVDYDGA